MEYEIEVYQTDSGKIPFNDWLLELSDIQARQIIRARLARVQQGNFGNCESVATQIRELKIDIGPGYRIYFSVISKAIIILLWAGTKRTQNKDIEKAKQYLKDFKVRGPKHAKK